jgi:hypothetical protein
MALQMPAFISGLLPDGTTPKQQVNNANPTGVFDPSTGLVLPPQLLGGRLNAANEMLREGSSGAPVGSWTQGMNRVLQGLVGGYEENKYANQYMQGMQQGAQAGGNFLSSLMGGGGSTPTAAPVAGASSSGATPDASVTPGAATGGATSPLAKQAFDYFVGKGYTPAAAAGLVGNFNQESGFSPSNISAANGGGGDGGVSQHLAQWNGPRLAALNAFAAQRGTSPGDYQTQLDFVDHELNTTEAATGNALRGVTDPVHAAAIAAGYERPQGYQPGGNPALINGWQNRARSALSAFQTFGGDGAQNQVAAGPTSAPAPYQTVQQEQAQADATAGQPLPTSIPNAGPQAPANQVASLDPNIVPQMQQRPGGPPLPPLDPRTLAPDAVQNGPIPASAGGAPDAVQNGPLPGLPSSYLSPADGSLNKGNPGATPGQQAVLSAASPAPVAPPGGQGGPPLTPGGQTVAAALPAAGGAPSTAPPLSPGGQQVAQAAMPQMAPQQGGLSPQQIQQYTAMMANPYVPEAEKTMAASMLSNRLSPHKMISVPTTGGTMLMDEITGAQRGFIPSPNYQKITMQDGSERVLNMNDPQQAQMASGAASGGGSPQTNQLGYSIGSTGGINQFPGQKLDTDEQSYNAYASDQMRKGIPASQLQPFQDYQLNLHRAGSAQVNMNQQTDWDKLKDKAVFDHINPYIEQGRDAAQRLRLLNYLDGVITQYGDKISTGPGADAIMKVKESLVNTGLADPNAAGPTEILQHVGTMLAQQQAKALTSRPTQFDFGTMLRNDPNASMSLAGSHALINLGIQDANRDMELGHAAYGWMAKNGPNSDPTSFDSVVQSYDKDHAPVLPNFGTPTAPGQSGAPTAAPPIQANPGVPGAVLQQRQTQPMPAPQQPQTPIQQPAPQSQQSPPIAGAKKAGDGNWYVPDTNRPGKYLKVVP